MIKKIKLLLQRQSLKLVELGVIIHTSAHGQPANRACNQDLRCICMEVLILVTHGLNLDVIFETTFFSKNSFLILKYSELNRNIPAF